MHVIVHIITNGEGGIAQLPTLLPVQTTMLLLCIQSYQLDLIVHDVTHAKLVLSAQIYI